MLMDYNWQIMMLSMYCRFTLATFAFRNLKPFGRFLRGIHSTQ
jgi:hypothetical protein